MPPPKPDPFTVHGIYQVMKRVSSKALRSQECRAKSDHLMMRDGINLVLSCHKDTVDPKKNWIFSIDMDLRDDMCAFDMNGYEDSALQKWLDGIKGEDDDMEELFRLPVPAWGDKEEENESEGAKMAALRITDALNDLIRLHVCACGEATCNDEFCDGCEARGAPEKSTETSELCGICLQSIRLHRHGVQATCCKGAFHKACMKKTTVCQLCGKMAKV